MNARDKRRIRARDRLSPIRIPRLALALPSLGRRGYRRPGQSQAQAGPQGSLPGSNRPKSCPMGRRQAWFGLRMRCHRKQTSPRLKPSSHKRWIRPIRPQSRLGSNQGDKPNKAKEGWILLCFPWNRWNHPNSDRLGSLSRRRCSAPRGWRWKSSSIKFMAKRVFTFRKLQKSFLIIKKNCMKILSHY